MESEIQDKKKKQETESAADLERVTDYAEEKEINVGDFGSLLADLGQRSKKNAEKERELAQIKISKEDVELVVKEMDISKAKAERTLRECKGNVVKALTILVNS